MADEDPREERIRRRLAARVHGLQPSIIRELMPLAMREGMISLGGGYPHPSTFPFRTVSLELDGRRYVIEGADLERACQYGPSAGHPELLEQVIEWHRFKSGVTLAPGELCMLNGSQEALYLLGYLFLEHGDPIVVPEPAYPGAIAAFRCFTDNLVAIPQDGQGLDVDSLGTMLERRRTKRIPAPKFLYLNPTSQNPAGISLPRDRRQRILELAEEHDLLVIDDDPYEMLVFDEAARQPTLQSLDAEGLVIRLDSFSKVLVPGFRLGYLSGHPLLVGLVRQVKGAMNIEPSGISQAILLRHLREVGIAGLMESLARSRAFYRRNYQALHEALRDFLGGRVRYHEPDGGFFVWVEIEPGGNIELDTREMVLEGAEGAKVLAIPGAGFSVLGGLRNFMRLSFSQESPERLREGILRLARMIHDHVTARSKDGDALS